MNMDQIVSSIRVSEYNREELIKIIYEHFDRIDAKSLIKQGMRVALKVNLLMKRRPDQFTTTHPDVVYAVIRWLQNQGISDIVIVDSPSGIYNETNLKAIYKETGMEKLALETGVELNYNLDVVETKSFSDDKIKTFTVLKPLLDADFIIDICKAKTHGMTMLSGGVKNMFGSIPGLMKPQMHYRFQYVDDFAGMLVNLCQTMHPDITVCDAIVGMMGDGPNSGIRCEMGYILASRSPYTLDVALCNLMGFHPMHVPTVYESIKKSLTKRDVEIVGDSIVKVKDFIPPTPKGIDFTNRVPVFLRKPMRYILRTLLTPKPIVDLNRCVGCGKCAESCPQHTIDIVNRKAIIDYSKCQKCYCCHEMCPIHAIDVKKSVVEKI